MRIVPAWNLAILSQNESRGESARTRLTISRLIAWMRALVICQPIGWVLVIYSTLGGLAHWRAVFETRAEAMPAGVDWYGDVNIRSTTISANQTTVSGVNALGIGGGIFLFPQQDDSISITSSSITGNVDDRGGGIYVYTGDAYTSDIVIDRSTISGINFGVLPVQIFTTPASLTSANSPHS